MRSVIVVTAVIFFVFCQDVAALPRNRVKRVSDQRLAELETLVALSKMSGKLVTVPLGLGKVDPKYIGRKRRSESRILDTLFNHSSEEDSGDPIELDYEEYSYRTNKR